jgi:hypothetical protein
VARGITEGLEIERVLFATEDQKTGMRSLMENGPGKAVFEGRLTLSAPGSDWYPYQPSASRQGCLGPDSGAPLG